MDPTNVFLIYANDDQAAVRPLIDALRSWSWDVSTDATISGPDWHETLDEQLEGAFATIVVSSAHTAGSSWITREIRAAIGKSKLFVVLLGGHTEVPVAFTTLGTVDLSGWTGDAHDPLFREIRAALDEARTTENGPRAIRAIPILKPLVLKKGPV